MRSDQRIIEVGLATIVDREVIYRMRHEVYAGELGQHRVNEENRLTDPLDSGNIYIVVREAGAIAGFISVTLPSQGSYSIDKYFRRECLPFTIDKDVYEIRLLTVLKEFRGGEHAGLLMHAAFRLVQSRGGKLVVAIGRREVVEMYERAGMERTALSTKSGAVTYDLLYASVTKLQERAERFERFRARVEQRISWAFEFAFRQPAACFHGGAFFKGIGERFETLERRNEIINSDVLDAWFPPSPRVVRKVEEHLEWLLRTSPPADCVGFVEAVAEGRGVAPGNILPGAGSSDLMFRAFGRWLNKESRALVLDPTYGEYAHLLERVVRCRVDRLALFREQNYDVAEDRLLEALGSEYDLVVLVNPNSPTGRCIPRETLERALREAPERTKFWIDETYIDYATSWGCADAASSWRASGLGLAACGSLERFAVTRENVVVCKSMSKVYGLSGARAAYLCAAPQLLEDLRSITPPWVISLPAQVAAVEALRDSAYYAERHRETHILREELAAGLSEMGWDAVPGCANFLLCHLPPAGQSAAELVGKLRVNGLFIRDASSMSPRFGGRAVRIAVKDRETTQRMLGLLRHCATGAAKPMASAARVETRERKAITLPPLG